MDKILIFGAITLALLGALFIPRTARAGTVEVIFPTQETAVSGTSPFGIANNNPFNLRYRNIGWRGETGERDGFSVFDTAENGIRAGMINIHTKMTRDNANTVRKLISVLSPPNENPTEAFVQFVSQKLGVSADQRLIFGQHITALSKAIIQFENGQNPYTFDQLEAALRSTGKV